MNLGSRRVRLRAIWLLLIPFLFLARPTPRLLVLGGSVAVLGTVIRGWAAGCIKKDRELAVTGPYAHTRNPLYLGSLVIGLGVTVAGGWWVFVAVFLLFFAVVYRRTMKNEERLLEAEFGDEYRRYREAVPALLPRLTPYRPPAAAEGDGASTGGGIPAPDGDGSNTGEEMRLVGGSGPGDSPVTPGAAPSASATRIAEERADDETRPTGSPWRFSPRRYLRNREWEAALGVAAGFAFLAIKMVL